MLKTLEIRNFKSIRHAVFDLGKINVLSGKSNIGKSNVVWAIYCLAHNQWSSSYLTWGEKKCSIRLTDDTGEWVEYRHNETSAEYSLSTVPQPFTKIGHDVPEPVKSFLKMNLVQFDEDLYLDFNFEKQFDPGFVISLSGFELAKVFGKLMNLDIVMSAARNINKDIVALRKDVESQEAVERVSIQYIQEHYPIELKYALLHEALKADMRAEELDAENSRLQGLLLDLEYQKALVDTYKDFLDSSKSKQIDSIREPVYGLDNVIVSLEQANLAQEAYSKALVDKVPEFDFEGLNGLIRGLVGVSMDIPKVESYIKALDGISKVDFSLAEALMERGALLVQDDLLGKEVMNRESQLKNQEALVSNKVQEFNEYLKANNVCPISGKPFMDGCISNIVESVV